MKIFKKDKNLYEMFSKNISKEALKKLKKEKIPDITDKPKEGFITYIILQIKDDSPSNIDLISEIVGFISRNNGFISTILPCFVVATFGFPFEDNPGIDSCKKTVMDIINGFPTEVKTVYGSEHGVFRNIGTSEIFAYIPLIPNFSQKISTLISLSFGEELEIRKSQ